MAGTAQLQPPVGKLKREGTMETESADPARGKHDNYHPGHEKQECGVSIATPRHLIIPEEVQTDRFSIFVLL